MDLASDEAEKEKIMNKVILMGRLTRDPETRYTQGDNAMAIARYTLAIDRQRSKNTTSSGGNEQTADFINCVAFGKNGEFAEKYLKKGTKIAVEGRIQTGSYTNKEGQKVYTTDVVVERHEFVESKSGAGNGGNNAGNTGNAGGNAGGYNQNMAAVEDAFLNIPAGIDDELPF